MDSATTRLASRQYGLPCLAASCCLLSKQTTQVAASCRAKGAAVCRLPLVRGGLDRGNRLDVHRRPARCTATDGGLRARRDRPCRLLIKGRCGEDGKRTENANLNQVKLSISHLLYTHTHITLDGCESGKPHQLSPARHYPATTTEHLTRTDSERALKSAQAITLDGRPPARSATRVRHRPFAASAPQRGPRKAHSANAKTYRFNGSPF